MTNTCFIIQPFDGDAYGRRYDDILAPAIESSGLKPYRVDRDPSVNIPIEDIEKEIENSQLCLADISEDNPNVWFEIGMALAKNKDLIMISKKSKKEFPFDVRHRNIITYKTESTSDFKELKSAITNRAQAILKKNSNFEKSINIINQPSIATKEGLSPHEMMCLISILENPPEEGTGTFSIRNDLERAGYTTQAVNISLVKLAKKELIKTTQCYDFNGNDFPGYKLTDKGLDWILHNEDKFELKKTVITESLNDDEIPF